VIALASDLRVWLRGGATDLRRGMYGLSLQVQEGFGGDPFAGELFAFRGRRGQLPTFCIRFPIRDGCLPLAPAVRTYAAGLAVSSRQGVDVHLYRRTA
jgi:hypothetical protein